jgi:hypothetical protein
MNGIATQSPKGERTGLHASEREIKQNILSD